MYELHLGRYGSTVSGLVVRYWHRGADLDNFQRANDCGCFFVEGGLARDERLSFGLLDPANPGQPDGADVSPSPWCASPPPDCPDRRLRLALVDDRLSGVVSCGEEAVEQIVFEPAVGSPRTRCVLP